MNSSSLLVLSFRCQVGSGAHATEAERTIGRTYGRALHRSLARIYGGSRTAGGGGGAEVVRISLLKKHIGKGLAKKETGISGEGE